VLVILSVAKNLVVLRGNSMKAKRPALSVRELALFILSWIRGSLISAE